MKTIICEETALIEAAAAEIAALLKEKPRARIAMAAGRTMRPLWKAMKELPLEKAKLFQVAEFCDADEERSLKTMLLREFIAESSLKEENCVFFSGDDPVSMEEALSEAGGLDLAVLGIGVNASIGFNEPATQFDTRCHRQKLTEKTRKQFEWRFGSEEDVPAYGLTMGIRTLTEAGQIIVIALGEEKKQAVFDMLYARDDSVIPAAFLQIPANVSVYADEAAGAKL